jgi:predicted extracellular nuclease
MAKGDISFATFNLMNFNLPGLRIYTDADGWTQDEYDRKVAWTGTIVQRLAADVIGFEELWHPDALAAIFAAAGLTGQYDLLTPPDADGTRIVCAAAVRKGLLTGDAPRWIADFPDGFRLESQGDDAQTPEIAIALKGFSRPVLQFEVRPRTGAPSIHVHVCHLKSKAPAQVFTERWYKANKTLYAPHANALGSALATIRRTAEAAALRWIITARIKETDDPVVVLGDLNDGEDSNTLNILTAQPNYLKPFSRPAGSDAALYSAQALQQLQTLNDVYYTHVHQQRRESLDHVLVSEQLYDGSKKHLWGFEELTIDNDHLNSDDHKLTGTSDHGVVRVLFKYRPAK